MSLCIITSSVKVNSKFVTLNDAKAREENYIHAIGELLKSKRLTSIIVCDNTFYDYSTNPIIQSLLKDTNIKFEALYFEGDNYKVYQYGKGYGEGEIMKYIFENSLLLDQYDTFFKITGRLYIKNFDDIIKQSSNDEILFIRTAFRPNVTSNFVKTVFYKMNKAMYTDYFLNKYDSVRDDQGYYLEHVYFDSIKKNGLEIKFFKTYPNIIGLSGSTGKRYNENFWLKFSINKIYSLIHIM